MPYRRIAYSCRDQVATVSLTGEDDVNTIVPPMLEEIEAAVVEANRDDAVKVIVLQGAGKGFCAGFNFSGGFHQWDEQLASEGCWDPGRDLIMVTGADGWVHRMMSLWRSSKPVIAKVHGWALGGGSELALSADIVIASDDAVFGTPYSRMWGCHHAGMWVYRLGLAKAKELALTGEAVPAPEAVALGLINRAVPFAQLHETVDELARKLCSIPSSQLAVMKLVVNQAYEAMGLRGTQQLGSVMDSMMRNTPEALQFIGLAERSGVRAVVKERDSPFGDYSQAPPERKPNPNNIIQVP